MPPAHFTFSASGKTESMHCMRSSFAHLSIDVSTTHHSGKSATIRKSIHGSGVCKEHYAYYFVPKSSILLAGMGVWQISSVA